MGHTEMINNKIDKDIKNLSTTIKSKILAAWEICFKSLNELVENHCSIPEQYIPMVAIAMFELCMNDVLKINFDKLRSGEEQ